MTAEIRKRAAVPDVSVVVPARNEAPSLSALYSEIEAHLASFTWELLIVDDGSTDDTFAIASSLADRDPRVSAIRLRRGFGKAAALSTGFKESRGRSVVTMDADLQDDPAEIPRLLGILSEGYDVVSGWKSKRKDRWSRRLASKIFNRLTNFVFKISLHDVNCGLKAYSAEAAQELADSCYGELHRFLPALAHWLGYRITETPVNHRRRAHGKSRYGPERYVRGFLDLLTTSYLSRFGRRPMHVFGGIGLLLFVPGLVALSYLVISKSFFGAAIGDRPLLILGGILAIVGLQLLLTGLLAEMVSGPRASDVPYSTVASGRRLDRPRRASVISLDRLESHEEEQAEVFVHTEPS